MARPIPWPPPVTIATFSTNLISFSLSGALHHARLHAVAIHGGLIQRHAESRSLRQGDRTVGSRQKRLFKQRLPQRVRILVEFQQPGVREAGDEVHVGDRAYRRREDMWNDWQPVRLRHCGDLTALSYPASPDHVGL